MLGSSTIRPRTGCCKANTSDRPNSAFSMYLMVVESHFLLKIKDIVTMIASEFLSWIGIRVDGLAFFLVMETRESLHLESRVKEKALPILRENWNDLPWLVSALQKSKHCAAREESDSPTVAILVHF